MPSLNDKKRTKAAIEERHQKDAEILCQKFAELFSSEMGTEILAHLFMRFNVDSRVHIPDINGQVDPIRAAIRDGERACPLYILAMARKANPKFPHP
jgi:hypothetical protein